MSELRGDAEARAVLLHGFTGSSRAWDEGSLECLGARGVEAVPVDLPGHGALKGPATGQEMSLDATLHRIAQALDGAADASPRHLIGYSMGGRLALHYAVRFPDRVSRLVLESASPGLATEGERAERRLVDEALAQRLESEGIASFVDSWEALPLFASQRALSDERRARIRAGRLANDPFSLAEALRRLGTGALPSLWNELSRLETEVLVVVGALDTKFVEIGERMVAHLPHGRLTVVPGAGHTVHMEAPEVWCAEVTDFLTAG